MASSKYRKKAVIGLSLLLFPVPAIAQSGAVRSQAEKEKAFTTGVAKGRDLLDSAISTSSMDDTEIAKLGPRTFAEIARTIPGIRVEAGGGENDGSYTIRGLPLAGSGSKFLQFQEDGLPVLEFGNIAVLGSDYFLRVDSNVSQIQTIRGGSASTFASNSPGGVINLVSKTGNEEGGAVQFTTGLDYGLYRADADFGSKLTDSLRFHVGGFYRTGEGPRDTGFTSLKGGQVKINITKDFSGGFVRLYGKYLNDRAPRETQLALAVAGSNANPSFSDVPGLDAKRDSVFSRNLGHLYALDRRNQRRTLNSEMGSHSVVKSVGFEGQIDLAGWTVSNKFRFSDVSADTLNNQPIVLVPASTMAMIYGGRGATLSYASGPNAGGIIADPSSLNGNGLAVQYLFLNSRARSLDNLTNDVRATRAWPFAAGTLTTTVGSYHVRQDYDADIFIQSGFTDVVGGGNASLLNIRDAGGQLQTQGGIYSYAIPNAGPRIRRTHDVTYNIDAPYGSINYHVGRVAVGASLRYDIGRVRGRINSGELGGGRVGIAPFDMNGDGVITLPEQRTALLPQSDPAPVDYNYGYLSYSAGLNYRLAQGMAVFGRYSRGARAGADNLLFSRSLSPATGKLMGYKGFDPVRQAEVGAKFRHNALALNVTGFWAETSEQNDQVVASSTGQATLVTIARDYEAKGVEFEGSYGVGPFHIAAGATYTKAEIKRDALNLALVGNTPRHQPELTYSVTPQFDTDRFTLGANVTGFTESHAQDVNQLRMPGYAIVNAFIQYRPAERLQLSVNANNLFDVLGLTDVTQGALPPSGLVLARAVPGRIVSASVRLSY